MNVTSGIKAHRAAPETTAGGVWAFVPALALALAGLVALAGHALTLAGTEGQFLVVTRPGLPMGTVMDMIHRAGGGLVGFGAVPGVAVALSDHGDFADRVRRTGAWIVVPAPGNLGCTASNPGKAS